MLLAYYSQSKKLIVRIVENLIVNLGWFFGLVISLLTGFWIVLGID